MNEHAVKEIIDLVREVSALTKERDKLREKLAMTEHHLAHTKSERTTHWTESQEFVKSSAALIAELRSKNESLLAGMEVLRDQRDLFQEMAMKAERLEKALEMIDAEFRRYAETAIMDLDSVQDIAREALKGGVE